MMKKTVIVFVAVFCFNGLVLAQEKVETVKYFKKDNTFYLGCMRLTEHEVRQTLSRNLSAREAWEKGNTFKKVNTGMKVATGVLIGVGGCFFIYSLFETALLPNYIDKKTSSRIDRHFAISAALLASGVITGAMIPITKAYYKSHYSDAAKIYNRGLQSKTAVILHIGVTGNGFSLNLKF